MAPSITINDISQYVCEWGGDPYAFGLKWSALTVARMLVRNPKITKKDAIKASVLFHNHIIDIPLSEAILKQNTFIERCNQFGVKTMIKLLEEENNG